MRHSRPGYALLESTAFLALVVIFLILAGQLVKQGVEIQRQSVAMEWAVSRAESALRDIRRDVWTASAIEVDQNGTLRLNLGPNDTATWTYLAEPSTRFPERGWLIRNSELPSVNATPPTEPLRYEVPQAVSFTALGNGVRLTVGSQEVSLASQVLQGGWLVAAHDPEGRP